MKLVSYDYKGSAQIGLLLGDDQVLNVAQIVIVIEVVGLGIDRARIIASTIQRIIEDIIEVKIIAWVIVNVALGHDEIICRRIF